MDNEDLLGVKKEKKEKTAKTAKTAREALVIPKLSFYPKGYAGHSDRKNG